MNRMRMSVIGALSCWLGITAPAMSQQQVAGTFAMHDALQKSQEVPRNPLGTVFSIDVTDVPLGLALNEIVSKSGVAVVYSKSLLPMHRRVTVRGNAMTLDAALKQVLAGTGMAARQTAGGQVTIGKESVQAEARAIQGIVMGKVIDVKTKAGLVGARISFGDSVTGIVTGNDGSFRLTLPIGEHVLRIRAVGYMRYQAAVTVKDGESVTIEAALTPSASVLDEVVVTGTVVATERKAIPTPITVITGEDIERRGITRVEQLLRGEVPGVVALDMGARSFVSEIPNGGGDTLGAAVSSAIYSRGNTTMGAAAKPNPLKTYVDGIELLDPSALGSIDPASIERIEIITGPQAATIYGSGAMGGVMQIFTKKANAGAPEITVGLKLGQVQNSSSPALTPMHNHSIRVAGSTGAQWSYSATATYGYTGQWIPALWSRRTGGSVGVMHNREQVSISGSVNLSTSSNGTSGNSYLYSSPKFTEMIQRGEYSGQNVAVFASPRIASSFSQTVSLDATYRITPQWSMNMTLGRNQVDYELDPQSPKWSSRSDSLLQVASSSGNRYTASLNSTFSAVPVHWLSSVLTVGANGNEGKQTRVVGCLASSVSSSYIGCYAGSAPSVTRPRSDQSWGGFGNWQLGLFERLYLTLGLRGEKNPNYGRDHRIDWTPTNGLAYTLEFDDVTIKLLGSYGRATRPPTPDMRLEVISISTAYQLGQWVSQRASPELRPEYSRGPQGGVEVYLNSIGSFTLNRYVQRVSDLIRNVYVDTFPTRYASSGDSTAVYQMQYQNVASIKAHGVESTLSLNLFRFNIKGTYSWNDSRIESWGTVNPSYYPGRSFLGVPTHAGNLIVGYSSGKTSASISTSYIGEIANYNDHMRNQWYSDNLYARLTMYTNRRALTREVYVKPGYAKSDLASSYQLNASTMLQLNITNLANHFESDYSLAFPTMGRQTTVGVSLKFPR